jgi:hypothetical protein
MVLAIGIAFFSAAMFAALYFGYQEGEREAQDRHSVRASLGLPISPGAVGPANARRDGPPPAQRGR